MDRERNAASVGPGAAQFVGRLENIMFAQGFARPGVPPGTARPSRSKHTLHEFTPACDGRELTSSGALSRAVIELCDTLVGALTHGHS